MPDPASSLPLHLAETPIRMIVADIDGCLSKGTGHPFDHTLLQALARANEASRTDPTMPCITICTGRPQPYVECLLQAIGGYRPALCESGTVFFDPATHSILNHPDFGEAEEKALADLRHEVAMRLEKPNVKPEPGKITHITLIIQPPDSPESLRARADEIVAEFGDMFYIEPSRICLHFLFRHMHKGTGLRWLSQDTGIPLQQMAGIGDAVPDLPFLEQVGFAFAPANAQDGVKDACHTVSDKRDSEAALELLDLVVAHNRELQNKGHLLMTPEVAAG